MSQYQLPSQHAYDTGEGFECEFSAGWVAPADRRIGTLTGKFGRPRHPHLFDNSNIGFEFVGSLNGTPLSPGFESREQYHAWLEHLRRWGHNVQVANQ